MLQLGVINKLIELGLEAANCANEVINYSICSVEFSIILFGIAKLQIGSAGGPMFCMYNGFSYLYFLLP
ncbi:hypothetical protein RchiOBHm_Chr4g0441181 [Rosa chinensis]|uniref:Uncharacterized protein n=1 Tax=Rosa chinensis TaxID=74649 RepID=A0A2P6R383_ROSCH|nr:hypothetical protein RchiOBHm_Chr4g0441181 [Rosa chinensis]